MQLQQINEVFGMSLSMAEHIAHDSTIQLKSSIYQNVLSKIENQYGNKFLKFDISPENYMKYKNGKTSSMIKSNTGGIQEHAGFEAVEMVNLVDSIFMEVDRYYTTQIISQFNNSVNRIFQAISSYQSHIIHQVFYSKKQEQIEELSSFKDFFEDINDELGEIATSSIRAISYVTKLVDIRTANFKIYNFFINNLENWIYKIRAQDTYCGSYINNPINFQELEKDFYFARQSISTYMISLIYEHIICGNIDMKSKNKIIAKLKSFLSKFHDAERNIKDALIARDNSNRNWNWHYYQDKKYDSNEINYFLQQSSSQEIEIEIVNTIFDKSTNILKNIIITEEKDNEALKRNT